MKLPYPTLCRVALAESCIWGIGCTLLIPYPTLTPSVRGAQDDFNSFLWNVVMLAMGGSALGEAVKSSGLLLSITQARRPAAPAPPSPTRQKRAARVLPAPCCDQDSGSRHRGRPLVILPHNLANALCTQRLCPSRRWTPASRAAYRQAASLAVPAVGARGPRERGRRSAAQRPRALSAAARAQAIESATAGLGPWALTATFCGLVLVATTFISHTVGAIVILPIVGAVGAQMAVRGRPVRRLRRQPCPKRRMRRRASSARLAAHMMRTQRHGLLGTRAGAAQIALCTFSLMHRKGLHAP